MKYDADMFTHQLPIVACFAQHLAYYRAAKPCYDKLNLKSPFWCATIDAHLMVAAIQWCKVFGSDGCNNSTHWKKTPTADVGAVQDSFRKTVLSEISFCRSEWDQYHKAMCDFRNKFVAHHELTFSEPVPDFDIALRIAYAYDHWMRELIRPDVYAGPRLKDEFENWCRQAEPLVEKAMNATVQMKE